MNSIGALSLLYFLMTLGSASVLFFSFKSSIDVSGRYFLLAEFLVLFTLGQVVLTNFNPSYINTTSLFLANWFGISSEIAILFSVRALTRVIGFKQFFLGVLLAAIYCALIEYSRSEIDSSMPVALYAIINFVLAFATYFVCRTQKDLELNDNQFLRWIGYLEFALGVFALIRIASYFIGIPIAPRNPTAINAFLFSVYIALSLFRYISYQSLRISWIDPKANQANYLNKNLKKIVNEKNQLLQRLISSNRALGISALASSLTHQLSQPLTGIALHTESVKRDLKKSGSNQKAVSALNVIGEQLGKLTDLVNNLRQLFIDRNHEFKTISLQVITNEILEIITPALRAKEISLTKSYQANPIVLGNSIQLQQVIINIFNNAIDAIVSADPKSRNISLEIFETDASAVLIIKDSGLGIAPEAFSTLFDLYKTTKQDGLGVGLWLSKTIIEKHQGRISASNSVTEGAVFKIEMPVVHSEPKEDQS